MIKKISFIVLLLVLVLNMVCPVSAQDQTRIVLTSSSAQMDFPLTLKFSSRVQSEANISDIRIRYSIEKMSFADVITEAKVDFSPSRDVNATWSLDMRKIGGLPPGSQLDYLWLVKDSSGQVLETSPANFEITDNRYQWKTLDQDKISLHWYSGDNSFAQTLMKTAQDSLVKLHKDTGAMPDKTIEVYIYANSNDLQGSMIYPQEWTGGVAFTSYNIIAIGISPSQITWGQSAMIHELTHMAINQVVFNPYTDIPVWLNEGLAMYSEGVLSPQYTEPLKKAIENNMLLTVRTISSPFSSYTDKSLLSYAESFSLVDYLIYNYGSAKMSELLATFKQGSNGDNALKTVYGFDMDGLNANWIPWVKDQYLK